MIVDDLIATGGTVEAAVKLVEQLGGKVVKILFLDVCSSDLLRIIFISLLYQYVRKGNSHVRPFLQATIWNMAKSLFPYRS